MIRQLRGIPYIVFIVLFTVHSRWSHKRRRNTEEKAKVVAACWETELLQFLAALAILHQDELKNRLIITLFLNSYK